MRTVNETLVEDYAERLRPLLPLARRAYGTQAPDSAPRKASNKVNELLLEYVDEKGGNVTHLANELGTDVISLAGLRRRLRVARSGRLLGAVPVSRKRGSKDPELVQAAASKIDNARSVSSAAYGEAVREVYAENISLTAVAEQLGISYFSLWTAGSHG